jgi:LacI family transcriptional regulator
MGGPHGRGEDSVSRPSASIYDVAERAGVSIATVSRVLRGTVKVAPETRDRVLVAAEELRWRPNRLARGLATKGQSAVGIVFPDLSGPYYSQVVLGFEEQAVEADRSVLILATHGRLNSDEMVLDLADRCDGLVVMDRTVTDDVVRDLEAAQVPVVLLARPAVGEVPAVRAENTAAATELVAHLVVTHGLRRLAFLGDPEAAPDVEQRWDGFRRGHADAGLTPPDKPVRSGFLVDDGYAAAAALLDEADRPQALYCANDEVALGACRAAHDLGLRIPRDLAVTGWDDNPAARALTPPLTTVRQPMRELGRTAGDLLSARMAGVGGDSLTLPTQPVIRRSCGCPSEEVPR